MNRDELQDRLYSLEDLLLHPDRESNRNALAPLFADEYKEFCSSGKIYNRKQTLASMMRGDPKPITIHNFYVTMLSENSALATYRTTTAAEVTHRSSLWVERDGRWQLVFHQGTAAA